MTYRATITLEQESYDFLRTVGGKNRSAFINRLLKEEKRRRLAAEIFQANQEEAEDLAYQDALSEWGDTLADGLT